MKHLSRFGRIVAGWLAALLLIAWRKTCRRRIINDPRPTLRAQQRPYVYALLHAHQIGAVMVNDEKCLAAMVSASADGDLLVPALRLTNVHAVRGSTRSASKDKGGRAALDELAKLVGEFVPSLLAVDGPRGPRRYVHRGIADLARATSAIVLPTCVIASRRWILHKTWDRMQIPKPFSTLQLIFGEPIVIGDNESQAIRTQVQEALVALEKVADPDEARTT